MQSMGRRELGLLVAVLLALPTLSHGDAASGARGMIETVLAKVCPLPISSGFDVQLVLPEIWLLDEQVLPDAERPQRLLMRFALADGGELVVDRRQVGERLRQFRVSVSRQGMAGPEPVMQAIADGTCLVRSGQLIRRAGPSEVFLDQLDMDLTAVRWTETLQASWPEGRDPGGVRIALIDSGLAYDLDIFRDRLARNMLGVPLGYDFWDMDPWPYDGDTSRGPYTPIRHGTAVASVLVSEAPDAALVPYRYPRPDMTRMADLLDRAAKDGVRVLAMPLGSSRAEDWVAFLEALDRHDLLAVVSAGNNGRDIDVDPIYPAAFAHPNILTVTSSDGFGRLAEGSNWGRKSVDIMLPAENLRVTDFRGAAGNASGSSYAVPRLAAMAVCLLAQEPELTASAVKARLVALATPSPFERPDVVAEGWIPDPLAD